MLERIIRAIKQRCPRDTIVVRGDPAFALPRLMDRLEQLSAELDDVHYGLGLAQDPLLLALAAPLLAEAAAGHDTTQHFVRRFTWPSYAAQTWAHPRDVVLEVEHGERGPNPRFVVATLTGFDAGWIYDRASCPRGQSESYIRDFKNALAADRRSCHRCAASAFRLTLVQ